MTKKIIFAVSSIVAISGLAFAFLIWLIYFHQSTRSATLNFLPPLNAFLNGLSALFLTGGLIAIFNKRPKIHLSFMIGAFLLSTCFLISYVIYHSFHGDTHFLGQGWIRPFYFFILISHIGLTIFGLPLILTTFFFALIRHFAGHKKIARYTYPLWLYVSVTGVMIYFLLRFNS